MKIEDTPDPGTTRTRGWSHNWQNEWSITLAGDSMRQSRVRPCYDSCTCFPERVGHLLTERDRTALADAFNVYEHEWRFFAPFTGEPFLIDGRYLCYFDGMVVNLCLFGLIREWVSEATFREIVASLPFVNEVQLIQAWGDFDPPAHPVGRQLTIVDPDMLSVWQESEFTTDVSAFELDHFHRAKKSIRTAELRGVYTRTMSANGLDAEHLALIDVWRQTHDVAPVASLAVSTLGHYCTRDDVYLIEARRGDALLGFAVLSHPVPDRALKMFSFGMRTAGLRIGDALTHEAILASRRLGAHTLHNGYADGSLAAFKIKWGAEQLTASYRHAVYARPGVWTERAVAGRFHWGLRVLSP